MPHDENATATSFVKRSAGQRGGLGGSTPAASKTPGGGLSARSALGNITNKVPGSTSKGGGRKTLGDITNGTGSSKAKLTGTKPIAAAKSDARLLAERYADEVGVENLAGFGGKELTRRMKEFEVAEMRERVAQLAAMPIISAVHVERKVDPQVEAAVQRIALGEPLPFDDIPLAEMDVEPLEMPSAADLDLLDDMETDMDLGSDIE